MFNATEKSSRHFIREKPAQGLYTNGMAAFKKYQGLPDLDFGTEIYETTVPELTEASTLPTESDTVSDDGNQNPNFVRQQLDPDAARQRFEPYNIDARDVNFSDTINGGRRDYQVRSRRRRRRAALAREQQGEYSSDESEEETIQGRLAKLRKEATELQAEIEKMDRRDEKNEEDSQSEYEDVDDHQTRAIRSLSEGVAEVRGTLESAAALHRRRKGMTLEEEFMHKLQTETHQSKTDQPTTQDENLPQSSISAIAAFSDRLTLLETALGVPPVSQSQPVPTSILPTLTTLSTQIETLFSTLSPRPDGIVEGVDGPIIQTTTVHLDPIAEKIRLLISESKRLEESRKAATKSFEELLETRDRHAHLFHHTHTPTHSDAQTRLARTLSNQNTDIDRDGGSRDRGHQPPLPPPPKTTTQEKFTPLFLDSQSTKISALYNILPTIQSLQPLLPIVLERLRTLSVIHAGAADVKADMDDLENKLGVQEKEIGMWKDALENVEGVMRENKEVMRENVEVVGARVRGLEERIRGLGR